MYKVKLYTRRDGTEEYEVVSESKFLDDYKNRKSDILGIELRTRKKENEKYHYRQDCNKYPNSNTEKPDESKLKAVKEWIKENPKTAAAIGIGTAGLAIGGGIALYKHHKNKKKKSEEKENK